VIISPSAAYLWIAAVCVAATILASAVMVYHIVANFEMYVACAGATTANALDVTVFLIVAKSWMLVAYVGAKMLLVAVDF
jgi:hypothetical protein